MPTQLRRQSLLAGFAGFVASVYRRDPQFLRIAHGTPPLPIALPLRFVPLGATTTFCSEAFSRRWRAARTERLGPPSRQKEKRAHAFHGHAKYISTLHEPLVQGLRVRECGVFVDLPHDLGKESGCSLSKGNPKVERNSTDAL